MVIRDIKPSFVPESLNTTPVIGARIVCKIFDSTQKNPTKGRHYRILAEAEKTNLRLLASGYFDMLPMHSHSG